MRSRWPLGVLTGKGACASHSVVVSRALYRLPMANRKYVARVTQPAVTWTYDVHPLGGVGSRGDVGRKSGSGRQ